MERRLLFGRLQTKLHHNRRHQLGLRRRRCGCWETGPTPNFPTRRRRRPRRGRQEGGRGEINERGWPTLGHLVQATSWLGRTNKDVHGGSGEGTIAAACPRGIGRLRPGSGRSGGAWPARRIVTLSRSSVEQVLKTRHGPRPARGKGRFRRLHRPRRQLQRPTQHTATLVEILNLREEERQR